MRRVAANLFRAFCSVAGAYPTYLTSKPDIVELIKRLRPQQTDVPLIRLGPEGDGGYLIPDDLSEIEACFSPGVADVSGFELDCANRGIRVFMADNSVDAPQENHELFSFTKKYIGVTTNEQFSTLDAWVNVNLPQESDDLLLQMDIEGFEYETILSASDRLMDRFRIIAVEFHDLQLLRCKPFFGIASRCFEKILQTHTCVHIHPNNHCGSETIDRLEIPRVAEFTFLRNDRISKWTDAAEFPHPLDGDNTHRGALVLPQWWYDYGSRG